MRNTKSSTRKPSSRDIAKHFKKSHNTINDMSNSNEEETLNEYKAMSLYAYLIKQDVSYEKAMSCVKEVANLKRAISQRSSFLEKKVLVLEREKKTLIKQVSIDDNSELEDLKKENKELKEENHTLIEALANDKYA